MYVFILTSRSLSVLWCILSYFTGLFPNGCKSTHKSCRVKSLSLQPEVSLYLENMAPKQQNQAINWSIPNPSITLLLSNSFTDRKNQCVAIVCGNMHTSRFKAQFTVCSLSFVVCMQLNIMLKTINLSICQICALKGELWTSIHFLL